MPLVIEPASTILHYNAKCILNLQKYIACNKFLIKKQFQRKIPGFITGGSSMTDWIKHKTVTFGYIWHLTTNACSPIQAKSVVGNRSCKPRNQLGTQKN